MIFTLNDGGIYRSPDRGVTWSFIGAGIANVEFYDIALAATDPDLVIGGTQDNGTFEYTGSSVVWPQIIYGDGGNVRDWLHVDDHCAGILQVLRKGRVGEPHASAHRPCGGAWVINLKIPLLRQWQHETCDP